MSVLYVYLPLSGFVVSPHYPVGSNAKSVQGGLTRLVTLLGSRIKRVAKMLP